MARLALIDLNDPEEGVLIADVLMDQMTRLRQLMVELTWEAAKLPSHSPRGGV